MLSMKRIVMYSTAVFVLSILTRCVAFAPVPLQSRATVQSPKGHSYPRPQHSRLDPCYFRGPSPEDNYLPQTILNRVAPLYFRDRDAEDEAFTTIVANKEQIPTSPVPDGASSVSTLRTSKSGVSFQLIRAICFSQAVMLFVATVAAAGMLFLSGNPVDLSLLHWNGAASFTSFWDFSVSPVRVVQGIVATLPMIAFGSMVENSEQRGSSQVNFSTINMVVSLFGKRKNKHTKNGNAIGDTSGTTSTSTVLVLSCLVAMCTAISEEVLFRGYLPTAIWSQSNSVLLALLGQASLFGLGHVHKNSTLIENKVVSGLQFVNGLWQGIVYLITGDLLPCIIAHALYDMHVFVETWKQINDQMDWTALAVIKSLADNEEVEIRQLQKEIGTEKLSDETLAFCRRFFYAFDNEHRGSLSLRDVQRAITYAFLRDKIVPSEEQVRQAFFMVLENRGAESEGPEQRLRLPDFLKLLLAFKAQAQAQAVTYIQTTSPEPGCCKT